MSSLGGNGAWTPIAELVQEQFDAEENTRVATQEREPPGDWPDAWHPLSVFGEARLIGTPPCPPGLLPRVIEDWSRDIAERLGVDTAMVFMPMLAACAAAVDDRAMVQPLRHDASWKESARIWVAFVADSGEKKTPALKAALAPLYALEREWAQEDSARAREYAETLRIFTDAKKIQQKAAAKFLAIGKPLELPDLPNPPPPPPLRRKIVSDITVEALSEILSKATGGLLEVHDELSTWFGNFDAYRTVKHGKDRSLYMEAYNGGPQLVDRIGRGSVFVPNWSLSLVGGIQPEPMKRLAGQIKDDGLIQRFMVVFTQRGGDTIDRAPNEALATAYDRTIRLLATWDIGGPDARRLFTLSAGAHACREAVNHRVQQVRLMPWVSPAFHAHLAKWEGLFPRLLLLWHLIEHAETLSQVADDISAANAERVATFMLDFLLPHASRFYVELLQETAEETSIQWLAGHILAHALTSITARDIGRAYRLLRGKPKEIQTVMEHLTALGWVRPTNESRSRGPSHWQVNPHVSVVFAEHAMAERARRQAVLDQIREAVRHAPELGWHP